MVYVWRENNSKCRFGVSGSIEINPLSNFRVFTAVSPLVVTSQSNGQIRARHNIADCEVRDTARTAI